MKNRYGVDVSYFENKMKLVLRDINNYKPDELAREFARMSKTCDKDVIKEDEFSNIDDASREVWKVADKTVCKKCNDTGFMNTQGPNKPGYKTKVCECKE